MGGNEAPFEKNRHPIHQGVLLEETLIVKPHHVVVFHVVSEMFGANILYRAVAGPADPTQPPRQLIVVPINGKDRIVGALVYQVRGNDHAVAEQ